MTNFRFKNLSFLNNMRGISLVESLMTILIYAFISAACFTALTYGSQSWRVNSVKVELQQELRKAMDWITEDLRQAGPSSITNVPADGTWYNTITFKICNGASGGNISWAAQNTQYSKGGTGSAQLLRTTGAQSQVIAQDIQSLQFRRTTTAGNIVNVALTVQKNTIGGRLLTLTSNFQVKLRN